MKLVQLLRPLFLVALGLHALVLFLPTGNDEGVIETVALDELRNGSSPERTAPISKPSVLGALPVPDPNVPIPAASSQPTKASTTVATRPAARATPNLAARSTARSTAARQPVTPRSTANSASSQDRLSTSRPESNASSNQPSKPPQNERPVPNLPAQADTSSISPTANSDSANANASTTATGNTASAPISAGTLLAKVTRELPDSLRALAAKIDSSLTYNADRTDAASAEQARDDWQADIQMQANVGQIERMPPAEIVELTQIDYPVESSLIAAGRSLRRCLTEDPKTAEVGVLFDAQGNVADEPRLLRSTGYSALNEEIKALTLAYDDFPRDRASKAYSFEVEIFYDSELCITAEDLQA